MSYTKDREEFISIMGREGVSLNLSRYLLASANKLQRYAELACSSEAADRDRVRCPEKLRNLDSCPCRDYGNYAFATCQHGTVPRYMVREHRLSQEIERRCEKAGLSPIFRGDPRGAVLLVTVPSGRTNDWGQRGIAVPSRGFTAAQMERICR